MMALFYNSEIIYDSSEWLELTFGKALRQIRRHETMTMSELAEKSKVSQSYISQLENDVRLPSDKVIQDLSLALARGKTINVVDLFGNSDELLDSYDEHSDEFEVEQRQQDIASLLTKIKLEVESKNKKEEYLNAVSNSQKENVALSQTDLLYLKSISALDDKQKQFVLDFINFLANREE